MLSIQHFSKTYRGGKTAVSDLNLEILPGDICGFIGHNGAGKTTTLKAVAGILDFEEGDILVNGISIKQHPLDCKAVMAYIPDNPDLFEYLTGIQYLNFVSDIYKVTQEKREKQIQKYSDLFELTPSLGDLISSYSHGMKQKLAIISALIHEPKLLLLDEPFVGLDPGASMHLKEIMQQLCSRGCAIFFSTHVLEVAQKLCNRIAMIRQGKLVVCRETAELVGEQSLESVFMEVAQYASTD